MDLPCASGSGKRLRVLRKGSHDPGVRGRQLCLQARRHRHELAVAVAGFAAIVANQFEHLLRVDLMLPAESQRLGLALNLQRALEAQFPAAHEAGEHIANQGGTRAKPTPPNPSAVDWRR
jgi:hypothetical protein